MRTIILITLVALFASCERQSTFRVCETNEKVVLFNDIYNIGDTVVLVQTVDPLNELSFELDHNWINFDGTYNYLGDIGYYKAVVIN
jgi:hypothetical protein